MDTTTATPTLSNHREREILDELRLAGGSSRIQFLADRLGVSEETIRRNIRTLEANGLVTKVHGGVHIADSVTEQPLHFRMNVNPEPKRLIAAKAKDKEEALVNVRLVGRVSKVFYVLGEVNAPGAFPLSGRETVLDGIIAAGGITRAANTKKVILSRPTHPDGCRVVLPVCYDNVVQLGDSSTNYQLMPYDRVYVLGAPLVKVDTYMARFLAPINRAMSATLLGTSVYNSFTNNGNNAGLFLPVGGN